MENEDVEYVSRVHHVCLSTSVFVRSIMTLFVHTFIPSYASLLNFQLTSSSLSVFFLDSTHCLYYIQLETLFTH